MPARMPFRRPRPVAQTPTPPPSLHTLLATAEASQSLLSQNLTVAERQRQSALEEGTKLNALLAAAEQICSRDLALPFGDHPMLHSDQLARAAVAISCDVACREDAFYVCLQVTIDDHASIDGDACRRR